MLRVLVLLPVGSVCGGGESAEGLVGPSTTSVNTNFLVRMPQPHVLGHLALETLGSSVSVAWLHDRLRSPVGCRLGREPGHTHAPVAQLT